MRRFFPDLPLGRRLGDACVVIMLPLVWFGEALGDAIMWPDIACGVGEAIACPDIM